MPTIKIHGESIGSLVTIDGRDWVIDKVRVNGCRSVTIDLLDHRPFRPGTTAGIPTKQLTVMMDDWNLLVGQSHAACAPAGVGLGTR